MSLVADELSGPTVFSDLARLDFDYVPDDLPHRDDAIKFLSRTYRGLTQGSTREHALLWGSVGTGKTVVAKRFTRDLAQVLQSQHGKRMETVHVNCRRRKSSSLAMLGILNHFEPHYPERGFSTGEMLRDLRKHLERRDCHLVVILDEVDALLRADGSNLVYDLTRFNDEVGQQWVGISLILVSQQMVLDQLDDAALSTFKRSNVYEMLPYEGNQIEAIVEQRVGMAFHPHTVEPDVVGLIGDIAGIESGAKGGPGDARLSIELLWKAGVLADDAREDLVTPDHVRAAKAETYSVVTESKLRNQAKHPLLVLTALAKRLEKDGGAYATTGEVEKQYALLCEEHGETPRGHTQFWKYLKQLEDAGFLYAKLSGKGQAGTTQWLSIPDVPTKVLQVKVAEILSEA